MGAKSTSRLQGSMDACYGIQAPEGCAGKGMMRRLWAAIQDYKLVNVVRIYGDMQINTTLEGLRNLCGPGKDLVSLRSADHVLFLRDRVTAAGIDMTQDSGVPLAYDYYVMNRYFDLRNGTRDVTSFFHELEARGEMSGDFKTDERFDDVWGRWDGGQFIAGFGWGKSATNVGIADFSHENKVQAVICESLDTVGYAPHNDIEESRISRWAHTFLSSDVADDVLVALRTFYDYAAPSQPPTPTMMLRF